MMRIYARSSTPVRIILALLFLVTQVVIPTPMLATDSRTFDGTVYIACSQKPTYDPVNASATIAFRRPWGIYGGTYQVQWLTSWQWDAARTMWRASYVATNITDGVGDWVVTMSLTYTDASGSTELELLSPQTGRKVTFKDNTIVYQGNDFIFNHFSWAGVRHCGTVLDRHGNLLSGNVAEIDAVEVGTSAEYSTTSSMPHSFYVLGGLSGLHAYDLSAKLRWYDLVTVRPLGVMRNIYRIPTNPGGAGALIYDFTALALCPIGVHVFDYDRIEGVRGATVELWCRDWYDGGKYKIWAGPIETGEDGYALFDRVPEGEYDLKVYKDNYAITPDESARNPVDLDIETLPGYLNYRADFFIAPLITDVLLEGDSYVVVWNDNTTVESGYLVMAAPTDEGAEGEMLCIETTGPLNKEIGHRSVINANELIYGQYEFYVLGVKDIDDGEASVKSNIVTVDIAGGMPQLSISATPTSGANPLAVAFKSVAKNFAPTAWRWDFDDGTTSSEQNPTHIFNEGGIFGVALTVTGSFNGSAVHEDAAVDITVTDPGPVHARFSASPRSGPNPLEVAFTDQSTTDTGTITSWEWDFDNDGIVDATNRNPAHKYPKGGVYTVRLTVGNGTATDMAVKTDYITVGGFVADFGANPTTGALPLAVAFSNTTIGTVTHCEWDFGDGSPISNEANPTHTYTTAGTYDVAFTAGGPNGESDSIKRWNYITVTDRAKPTASFTANPYGGQLGQDDYGNVIPVTVQFADTSTAPAAYPITAWAWDFGNGSTSTSRNPGSISYETAGVYHVTLTATNSQGQDTADRYLTILGAPGGGGGTGGGGDDLPLPPDAYFYGSPTRGRAPLTVTFHDQSTNEPTSWSWNFGDGPTPSTERNPTHTYTSPGSYTVILTATNGVGSDTETKAGYIVVGETPPALTAAFVTTPDPAQGDAPLAVHFIDRSMPRGAITSWTWDFGDGSPVAGEMNPAHTYTNVGTYPVTLTVTHGIEGEPDYASAAAAGTVVVTGNRPPELAPIGNRSVNENATLTITLSATDSDGDVLAYSATGLPAGAAFNASTKTFTWKPTYDQAGVYPVTFVVNDGKATDSETITITVVNVNRAPATGSITPASGTGSYTTFTTTFTDADGNSNLKTARILINTAVSSAKAVYAMYDQTNDSFYLCMDAGSSTGWFGPVPRTTGTYTTIANSYGKLRLGPGSNTTVTKPNATTLQIKWDIEFLPVFKSINNTSATKNTYLYADDTSGGTCTWGSRKGVWTIPNVAPAVMALIPTSGGASYTTQKVFAATYSDKNGYADIKDARFLINTQIGAYSTVYVKYDYSTNKLYLCKDNDPNDATRWLGGYTPGTTGAVIENSQGKLHCDATTVTKSGETITIRWRISFKESYRGTKKTYLYMTDKSSASAGWAQRGTWAIQ